MFAFYVFNWDVDDLVAANSWHILVKHMWDFMGKANAFQVGYIIYKRLWLLELFDSVVDFDQNWIWYDWTQNEIHSWKRNIDKGMLKKVPSQHT